MTELLDAYDYLYISQHIIFAVSYLRVALVFKLAFSYENEYVNRSIRNRMLFIKILFAVLFLSFTLVNALIVSEYLSDNAYLIMNMVVFSGLTIILAFAVIRIRTYSRMLVQNKIFANEFLMVTHLSSFSIESIIVTTNSALIYASSSLTFDTMTVFELRLTLAMLIITYFRILAQLVVILTMMIMFLKHSQTLTESEQQNLACRFLLVFSSTEDLSEINNERIN